MLQYLGISYYVNFLRGLGNNEFHIEWRFGTHGSWKNQNPGGRFEPLQLNISANSAHFPQFLFGKWDKLSVLFVKRSQYIRVEKPLNKQSEKAYMC